MPAALVSKYCIITVVVHGYVQWLLWVVVCVGYGFNIRGGVDNCHVGDDPGIFVSSMRPDGSAAKDERLKKGDKVLSVSPARHSAMLTLHCLQFTMFLHALQYGVGMLMHRCHRKGLVWLSILVEWDGNMYMRVLELVSVLHCSGYVLSYLIVQSLCFQQGDPEIMCPCEKPWPH